VSAAAATLDDVVAAACHEARHRLRLYEHSRQQLLEAAALAQLSVQQQHDLRQQQQQQRQVPRQRAPAGQVAGAGDPAAGVDVSQQEQQQQQVVVQEAASTAAEGRRGCEVPAALPAAAAAASLADTTKSRQQLIDRLHAETAVVIDDTFGSSDGGSDLGYCPAAAGYAAFDRFCKTLALTSTTVGL
jgi:hypothetical protein